MKVFENKKFSIRSLKAMCWVLMLCVAIFTGCSVQEDNCTVNVCFASEDEISRVILSGLEVTDVGDLFWTYTATKTSGVGTVGECKTAQPVNPDTDGRGLSGFARQFSTGGWTFTVKGYLEKAHSTLVYSGTKEVKITTSDANKVIPFKLVLNSSVNGKVRMGTVGVRVPVAIAAGSTVELRVTRFTGTTSTTNDFSCKIKLSEAFRTGGILRFFNWDKEGVTLAAGTYSYCFTVYAGAACPACVGYMDVAVTANKVTVISGNLDFMQPFQKLGGKIYYIDGTSIKGYPLGRIDVDGRIFTFYQETSSNAVGSLSSVTAAGKTTDTNLLKAYWYAVQGDRSFATKTIKYEYWTGSAESSGTTTISNTYYKDNFYVYYPTRFTGLSSYRKDCVFSADGTKNYFGDFGKAYTDYSSGRTYGIEVAKPADRTAGSTVVNWADVVKTIGNGRANTDYILNLGCKASMTTPTCPAYDINAWISSYGTVTGIWKKLVETNVSDVADGGMGDWYIPSLYEAIMLADVINETGNWTSSLCLWYCGASCGTTANKSSSAQGVPAMSRTGSQSIRLIRSF